MFPLNAALLVNLLGFSVGIALYALLAIMVVRHRGRRDLGNTDRLLLMTAALGLLWNVGELYAFGQKDLGLPPLSGFITALSFSALGFLPSVVVHSARSDETGKGQILTWAAYALSVVATIMHFQAVIAGGSAPSSLALRTMTFGALALAVGLVVFNLRQTIEKKAIYAAALLVFAVSAFHLSGEREGINWYIELFAHQSSLPLALVILYQNYRFAFGDLFLKRAISLLLLTGIALGLYILVAVPMLRYHETHDRDDVQAAALIIGLWVGTALIYPAIYKLAVLLVDRVLLRREDYATLQRSITGGIEACETVEGVLDLVASRLARSLTAGDRSWAETTDSVQPPIVEGGPDAASVAIPTAELPRYTVRLERFAGGRRLLSDEIALIESVALIAARKIDALRVSNERYNQKFREQEFAKLATEAQLTALRSQINPHFLFNALTTIGYLIKASPDKAYDTLLRLTQLLRGVLKNTSEFTTLGEEIRLIESYLDIERARFEEKLRVEIDVAEELENTKVPSLILQPLVENAIKHAISENRNGGEIRISADLSDDDLRLSVWDSGAGKGGRREPNSAGVGLRNIRERLASYYEGSADLSIVSQNGGGTEAVVRLPVEKQR